MKKKNLSAREVDELNRIFKVGKYAVRKKPNKKLTAKEEDELEKALELGKYAK